MVQFVNYHHSVSFTHLDVYKRQGLTKDSEVKVWNPSDKDKEELKDKKK